jgi:dienelactone hydrolase
LKKTDMTNRSQSALGNLRAATAALLFLAACMGGLAAQPTFAQALNTSLNEQVVMVAKKTGLFSIELETTIYKPDGEGPFSIAVVNHGKSPGNPKFQARYRAPSAARYFLSRGYVVVVPMRRGFSKSAGSYVGGGCNVESNGAAQAEDVKDVLDYVTAQPYADKNQILVAGQSHGGWTTLAFGTVNYPGVKGLVNFAGGLSQDCSGWESTLARAAGSYGAATRLPSLWFYGDNDRFFSVSTYTDMFKRYTESGGPARLVAFGVFGSDSHTMFGSSDGEHIWQPEMTAFLKEIGLPSQQLAAFAKYRGTPASVPAAPVLTQVNDAPSN